MRKSALLDVYKRQMYYTEPTIAADGGMRDRREGKSGMSRRSYMESKELHKQLVTSLRLLIIISEEWVNFEIIVGIPFLIRQ